MLKKGLFISIIVLLLASCSDDTTSPDGIAQVEVISSMNNSTVKIHSGKKAFLDHGVDSLVVTKFRMLISSIKLHGYLESEDKNESLKIGPYVLKGDSTDNFYFLTEHSVPEGSYDKIKFEIHKFPESERVQYEGDPLFGQFATDDTYTILINGYYYENGEEIAFAFKSNKTENLSIKFDSNIKLNDDGVNSLNLDFNPELLFVNDGNIIVPTENNWKDIEKNIQNAIKVIKRTLN